MLFKAENFSINLILTKYYIVNNKYIKNCRLRAFGAFGNI